MWLGWAGVSEERRLTGSISVGVIANWIQLLFLECSTQGLYQDEEARVGDIDRRGTIGSKQDDRGTAVVGKAGMRFAGERSRMVWH